MQMNWLFRQSQIDLDAQNLDSGHQTAFRWPVKIDSLGKDDYATRSEKLVGPMCLAKKEYILEGDMETLTHHLYYQSLVLPPRAGE